MPTVYLLLATQCPAPQAAPALALFKTAFDSANGTAVGAKNYHDGQVDDVAQSLNWDSKLLDASSMVGHPSAAILRSTDFPLSAPSGTNITVGTGQCTIDGAIRENPTATQITLTSGQTNRVWFKRDGTFEVRTDTTAPAIPACHLWNIVVSGGGVIDTANYDRSGVFFHVGGAIQRRTADAAVPADSPTAPFQFYTVTAGGTYLWNGTAHVAVATALTGYVKADGSIPFTGAQSMGGFKLTSLLDPTNAQDAATKAYVDLFHKRDGTNVPTADQPWGGFKITGLGDPTSAQDAATKAYVDSVATGLDPKASVRAGTYAALPAATLVGNVLTANANGALPAIDGVTLSVGNSLANFDIAGGASASYGLYTVTSLGSAGTPWVLTRRSDADSSAEVTGGMNFWITEGTNLHDTAWVLTTNDPITLNTTTLAFSQFNANASTPVGGDLTGTVGAATVNKINGVVYSGDPLTQYLAKNGRSAGQTIYGGTGASEDLTLSSTFNATKRNILFGASAGMTYSELNKWLGIGGTPDRPLYITSDNNTLSAGAPSIMLVGSSNKERLEIRSATGTGVFTGAGSAGTIASPIATPTATAVAAFAGAGYSGSAWTGAKALIGMKTTTLFSATAQGMRIYFETTDGNDTGLTRTERFGIEDNGDVVMGTGALVTTTTSGFFFMDGCAGAPTGAPTSRTGRIACIFDYTNFRLYANFAGTWKSALFA